MSSTNIKQILSKKIPKSKLELVGRSFDIIGSIAIVEIKSELKKYGKDVAKAIMQVHKTVKTVLAKASAVNEKFRTRKLRFILGEKTKETFYKENNCLMKVDVEKVYFSPRFVNERKRIAEQVKHKENVLVYFAGVGPYALVIAKRERTASVAGIELNPIGVKYFEKNIKLNKLTNVTAVKGDVKRQAKKFANWADRIIMPHPSASEKFLDSAFIAAKDGCTVHFYTFIRDDNYSQIEKKIEKAATKNNCKTEMTNRIVARPYAKDVFQACLEFRVSRQTANL